MTSTISFGGGESFMTKKKKKKPNPIDYLILTPT